MKKVVALFAALCAVFALCGSSARAQSITEIANSAPGFSILAMALEVTGLDAVLDSADIGVTVFAPTDEAFLALPDPILLYLLSDPEALANVLLYHVVGAELFSDDVLALRNGTRVETLLGSSLILKTHPRIRLDASNVIAADIAADNGVIHVIDRVLLPKPR